MEYHVNSIREVEYCRKPIVVNIINKDNVYLPRRYILRRYIYQDFIEKVSLVTFVTFRLVICDINLVHLGMSAETIIVQNVLEGRQSPAETLNIQLE